MKSISALLILAVALPALAAQETYTLFYKDGKDLAKGTYTYCQKEQTLIGKVEGVHDVETAEFYFKGNTMVGRYHATEECVISVVAYSVTDLVGLLESANGTVVGDKTSRKNLIPTEATDYAEDVKIAEFCADYPSYFDEDTVSGDKKDKKDKDADDAEDRQISVSFLKCCFFICTQYTITIPTGTTIILFPFFG